MGRYRWDPKPRTDTSLPSPLRRSCSADLMLQVMTVRVTHTHWVAQGPRDRGGEGGVGSEGGVGRGPS